MNIIHRKNRDRWGFIVNTTAGRGRTGKLLCKLVNILSKYNFPYDLEITKVPRHAIELARNYAKKGYRKIVAVGGDGTINEVINGIMLSKKSSDIKFGIIPEGGGNDFARNFRVTKDVEAAVKILEKENTTPVDVGKIENQYFINALGLGFDAQVAEYASKIKFLNGLPRYFVALIKALVKLKPHYINLVINKKFFDISVILISIGNGFSTGGGFLLTPHAKVDDGKLDLCIIHEIKLGTLLKVLPKVFSGNHIKHEKVEIKHSDVIEIKTDKIIPIYFDGELPVLKNPYNFKIELIPKAINFICDSQYLPESG